MSNPTQTPAAGDDEQLIRSRLEQLVSGEVELLDAEQVFANIEARLIRTRLEQLMSGEVELLDADDVVRELKQRYAKKDPK